MKTKSIIIGIIVILFQLIPLSALANFNIYLSDSNVVETVPPKSNNPIISCDFVGTIIYDSVNKTIAVDIFFYNWQLREGHDATNSAFVGSSGQYDQLTIRSSEYTGTSSDPFLEVTYSLPTTVTYAYDASGQRIKYSSGTTTTYYPSKFYNTDGTTPQKHIFANGIELGVVKATGASAVARYIHTDQLTGSNVITNSSDTKDEILDYFPFGAIRFERVTIY